MSMVEGNQPQENTAPLDNSDNEVHTPANPYCGKPGCWCHNDSDYHEGFTHGTFAHPHLSDVPPTEKEIEVAYTFFEIPLVEEDDTETT